MYEYFYTIRGNNIYTTPFLVRLFWIAACREWSIKNDILRTEILIVENIPVWISSFAYKYIGFVQNNTHNDQKVLAPKNYTSKLPKLYT